MADGPLATMRILCLWLPNWPIQRLLQSRPELKGRAVALSVEGARGSYVASCCASAVAQGVRPEMPVAEAKSLVRNLAVEHAAQQADRQALARLAEECERFSPAVAVEEGDSPESLLLDISGLCHLWGSEEGLVRKVEAFIENHGYQARMAVGETAGLAWAWAHFGNPHDETRHSSFVIRHSSLNTKLPIESLRIADDTAALLRELGIETISQLMALPRKELASRFGEELLLRLDQMMAAAPEVLVPHREVPALKVVVSLEHPTGDRAALTHVLAGLTEQLARHLAARDQGAVLLVCALKCVGGERAKFRVGLLQPSAVAGQLMELIELHLETLRLTDEIEQVEIRAAVTGRLGERQRELFADAWPSHPHQLAVLVNRLSSRLGYEHVVRAKLCASAVPERAVQWVAMTGESRDKSRESRARTPALDSRLLTLDSSSRPLLLYPEAKSIEVMSVEGGPPQFVWLDGRRERIARHWGPERIETRWWRGPSVRRDYYRIATEGCGQLWIFRCRASARWFLHGIFA
jgi:protein ImuB